MDFNCGFTKTGGQPVAARRLHRLNKLLYQKRAEENFLGKMKHGCSANGEYRNSDFSIKFTERLVALSPSVSCTGEEDGFVVINLVDDLVSVDYV